MKTTSADSSAKLDAMPLREVGNAHHYENMVMYVSLFAFLAMAAMFFLILSL